jgi:nucleoside-diphosphate-sugar epimerase
MTGRKTEENESYILTGATGFLGSHIMAGLLLKGRSVVIMGRSSGSESLKERIRKLIRWFGIEHLEEYLEYYETDFLKTRIGLGEIEYEKLGRRKLSIIHCASDTSFGEKNRERVMKSNVENLSQLLNFALETGTKFFHFISSAYATGIDRIECHETPVNSIHFNNVYEESKAQAEYIISQRCREGGIPFTIIRPSIVYGDSVTGRSLKFNALYYPVRSIQHIKEIYLNDIKNHKGIKSAEYGIYINNEGILHLPIRIFIPNTGNINLIPVNYFIETMLTIIDKPASDTFYNITSDNPETMQNLASYTERFLNITGLEVVIGTPCADDMRNPPEELFDFFIKEYRPYVSDRRIFIRTNTNKAVPGALPPDLSYDIFQRCMAFAISVDWGRNLFTK